MANHKKTALWCAAAAASLWLSWTTLQGPETSPQPADPPALSRPPTKAESDRVTRMQTELMRQLKASYVRSGVWPSVQDLEGADPSGEPWLPDGLPDNPLVPGVSNVRDGCGGEHNAEADWFYCQENGQIQAGGLP